MLNKRTFHFIALRGSGVAIVLPLLIAASFRVSAAEPGKFTLTALNIPDIQRWAGLALVLQMPGGEMPRG